MSLRRIIPHLVLLFAAALIAWRSWTAPPEETAKRLTPDLWSGKPSDIKRISFETKDLKVTLEPQEDERGRYFTGMLDKAKSTAPARSPHGGHGGPDEEEAAGEEPAGEAGESQEREQRQFVAVDKANDLARELAPLRALRTIGQLPQERIEEFGLHEEQGKLEVTIGDQTRTLVLGGTTPGGRDRYVKAPDTGEAYVISGNIANVLMNPDSRLVEQNLHGWPIEEVESVMVMAGGMSRELVRHADKKNYWASPTAPEEKDETASNFMTKVERLRINKYEPSPEPAVAPEDLVMRVEFFASGKKPLGYVELARRKGGPNIEYLVKSEQSRWYGYVLRTVAEQLDQDVNSVVHP